MKTRLLLITVGLLLCCSFALGNDLLNNGIRIKPDDVFSSRAWRAASEFTRDLGLGNKRGREIDHRSVDEMSRRHAETLEFLARDSVLIDQVSEQSSRFATFAMNASPGAGNTDGVNILAATPPGTSPGTNWLMSPCLALARAHTLADVQC